MFEFEYFISEYCKDISQAKYKIGDCVEVKRLSLSGNIIAVNDTGDGIEYLLDTHEYLVWEHEITK